MQRDKLKLCMTFPLACVFAYLLLYERAPEGQPRPSAAPTNATPTHSPVSSALASLPAVPGVSTLATTLAAALPTLTLPRDPFAYEPLEESPLLPQSSRSLQATDEVPSALPDGSPQAPGAAEKLRLKATLIDRYGKLAFINDQVGREGQTVAGYTIVTITPGHVVMAQEGKVVHLRLATGGTP